MKKAEKSLGQILNECDLSNNAGYYDGRSVEYGDITAEKIHNVYRSIKKDIGGFEAEIFAQMVQSLPTLRASIFIAFTLRLQLIADEKGWWWNEGVLKHYARELLDKPPCKTTERIKEEFEDLIMSSSKSK